ncbi:AceK: isocitrate dehydrogenase kinase/phosphatase [Desulfosarcina variabilis str. Montpellier]|uniref:bifunctional isocitrate dehydrogenase kinase/phosphatase n=1 Tax=Desulfosarcina variabilis TaxID=2300 RepID=UPI003AFA1677
MTTADLARQCTTVIWNHFIDHQDRFRSITRRAAKRFMHREWSALQADTANRLNLYPDAVDQAQNRLCAMLTNRVRDVHVWAGAKAAFADQIRRRHDRELAETFFNSITRRVFGTVGVNRHLEFVHDEPVWPTPTSLVFKAYPLTDPVESVLRRIFMDAMGRMVDPAKIDAVLTHMADRLNRRLRQTGDLQPGRIEILRPVFYRGQGAYLIGRVTTGKTTFPLVAALLHPSGGVLVDALLLYSEAVSVIFSYTRSAFHVDIEHPAETIAFLKSILPAKPEADLYSAIGHFKHGKTVLYSEVCRYTAECTMDLFHLSPGKRGMVMIVFEMAGLDMVVKLIRDRFDTPKRTTRAKVMAQYDFIFHHYRVGRLVEAHCFEHLSFDRCWFSDPLLDLLLAEAGQTVHLEKERVVIDLAYLERRVIPLDVYLSTQTGKPADAVVIDFGNAIKDLAAANIFPGDMLLKNFGVTRHGRAVFYDYDEIVPLTDCRFRNIPQPRTYLEEMADEPWYTVEENDVFPEEFSRFLGLAPPHQQLFLSHHENLMQTDFWVGVQEEIQNGVIRHVPPYPPRYQLGEAKE